MRSSRSEDAPRKRRGFARVAHGGLALLRGLVYLLGIAWAVGAIYFDGPMPRDNGNAYLAFGYGAAALFFLVGLTKPWRRFAGWVLAVGIVLVPWLTIRPPSDGDWQPAWSRTAWVERDGDTLTFHNVRNFDHALDGTVTERWEERAVRLSNLRGLDYFHHAFGGDLLAHPVLSFDFGEDGRVAFSVETRRETGQRYEPLAGLYKRYGLIYLVGDERDFIRDRATVRDEPVRLYRAGFSHHHIRKMFLETVATLNSLHEKPRFYNTITANCTTSYRAQAPAAERARLDYRLLLNGKLESLLYEHRVIVTGDLPLDELRERATINQAARAAHDDPEFSKRIREGRPGF